jgi:hypothetical protein
LKTLRLLLIAAGCLSVLAGPSLADPAVTTATSNMRRAASPYSRIVQLVPANAQIDVQSCHGGWCYGSWRGLYGFLPSFAIARGGPGPIQPVGPPVVFAPPPPPMVVTAPVVVAPPVYHWGGPFIGGGWGYGWQRW